MHSNFPKPHISAKDAAKMIGVTAKTLRNWRSDCTYLLPYFKDNRGYTFYCEVHIKEFIENRSKYKRVIKDVQELSF